MATSIFCWSTIATDTKFLSMVWTALILKEAIIVESIAGLAVLVLGKEMAVKTLVGSALTTLFVGVFEKLFAIEVPIVNNIFLSAFLGAALIAVASGIMFYVKSSSGGTDIIALIVKKYSKINIGKALLITDFLIVVVGGLLSGFILLASSFVGLLIKTFGIDFVMSIISKNRKEG